MGELQVIKGEVGDEPVSSDALSQLEAAVLGAMILDGVVSAELAPGDFGDRRHRPIYQAMRAIAADGEVPDAVNVVKWLQANHRLTEAGGEKYLIEIVEAGALGDVPHGAQVVRRESIRRRAKARLERGENPATVAAWIAQHTEVEPIPAELFEPYSFEQARADVLAMGEGVSTGFVGLDRVGFLLQPGNVYSYAGRQGGGKTALLLETAMRHVESTPDACVLFVSFEGHRAELALRLLLRQVARHRVEDERDPGAPPRADAHLWIKAGEIPYSTGRPHGVAATWEAELARARDVVEAHFQAGRLVLLDGDDVPSENGHGAITVSRLVAALRRAPRRPTLAAFDYFQKVTPDDRSESRYLQLAAISDRLRRYSKGDGDPARAVPVLTAAQVNREAGDRQPGLDHVREADDLGNDGAGIVTIRLPDTDDPVKRMNLKIVKHRHGPTGGRFDLDFHGACGYFAEPDPEAEQAARISAARDRIKTDVARYLAHNPDASTREVRDHVTGKADVIGEIVREIRESEGTGEGTAF